MRNSHHLFFFFNVFYCKGNVDNDIQNLPYLLASFSVQLATVYEMSEKTFGEREKWINEHGNKEGKVCIRVKWPIRPELIVGFLNMTQPEVFLLPPGWDASPWQGYPQHYICRYPFIHLGGERHCESKLSCPRTQPGPGSSPGQGHCVFVLSKKLITKCFANYQGNTTVDVTYSVEAE